ncbi:hypothetical protein RJ640_021122 [Escallonia rubra]|uniref:DUF4283 domain-containing protein n=1 Tax=Escallonia rubra TaxID=112253 RepID=A0AA88R6J2_9ASTE|nr:hypothetical protein RJ640_021122 [Escallonia rubra]
MAFDSFGSDFSESPHTLARYGRLLSLDPDVVACRRHLWANTLIGRIIDTRKLSVQLLQRLLNHFWRLHGRVVVEEIGSLLAFHFALHSDMELVLKANPWNICGTLLVLQRWQPSMAIEQVEFLSFDLWLQLHFIPIELFYRDMAGIIRSAFGEFLAIDWNSVRQQRRDFFRVLVRIRLDDPLIPGLFLEPYDTVQCIDDGDELELVYGTDRRSSVDSEQDSMVHIHGLTVNRKNESAGLTFSSNLYFSPESVCSPISTSDDMVVDDVAPSHSAHAVCTTSIATSVGEAESVVPLVRSVKIGVHVCQATLTESIPSLTDHLDKSAGLGHLQMGRDLLLRGLRGVNFGPVNSTGKHACGKLLSLLTGPTNLAMARQTENEGPSLPWTTMGLDLDHYGSYLDHFQPGTHDFEASTSKLAGILLAQTQSLGCLSPSFSLRAPDLSSEDSSLRAPLAASLVMGLAPNLQYPMTPSALLGTVSSLSIPICSDSAYTSSYDSKKWDIDETLERAGMDGTKSQAKRRKNNFSDVRNFDAKQRSRDTKQTRSPCRMQVELVATEVALFLHRVKFVLELEAFAHGAQSEKYENVQPKLGWKDLKLGKLALLLCPGPISAQKREGKDVVVSWQSPKSIHQDLKLSHYYRKLAFALSEGTWKQEFPWAEGDFAVPEKEGRKGQVCTVGFSTKPATFLQQGLE